MNKTILKILVIVSIIIIILGIFAGKDIMNEVKAGGMPSQNIYIDGTDATAFTEAFVEIGSGLLGVIVIIYSVLGVICIWAIYGIIILIITVTKKYKQQRNRQL